MADNDPDELSKLGLTGDEKIVKEAKARLTSVLNVEGDFRKRFIDDLKFANADSDNMYQWPNSLIKTRGDERPCLTINQTRIHNFQIMNDARQNKPSVKIKAVGNGSTYESAQIFEALVRHIEYVSNAQSAYDIATKFQVEGGIGYLRVATDYAGDDTFDQEIYIRPFKDPLTVCLDPNIKEADGSDAQYAIVFDDMAKDEAEKQFPKYKDILGQHPLNADYTDDDWTHPDQVRVAEYFRRVPKKDKLVAVTDPNTGEQRTIKASKLPKEVRDGLADDPQTKFREIEESEIEWFLIIGSTIVERTIWPGKYIPIIRVLGEETNIEGNLDRKGHTRSMKDPQRMLNYWFSAAVEHVALQGKTPYVGPMDAFSNLETYWDSANVVNHAWLPYNAYDEQGREIPAPSRQAPPTMATAYIQGLGLADQKMRDVSGQYQAELGAPSNEISGVAIQQRQRQGDNATYHYIDNLALAIRFLGKILIDLIPEIYDTKRIIRIMAEDGVESEVLVDPSATKSYLEQQREDEEEAKQIVFNPNVGKYSVEADVGPAYATRRQEAFSAMMELAKQNPEFMKIAGDLAMKAADFPMADKLAERFQKVIPASIRGDGPTPEVQQLQQQLQHMGNLLQSATQALGDAKKKEGLEQQQKNIDAYRAETDRGKVFLDHKIDVNEFALNVAQLLKDMMQTPIGPEPEGPQDNTQPMVAAE